MQSKLPGIISSRQRRSGHGDKEPLQIRIPAAVKRRFKSHAALRGLEPNELFVEVWDYYETRLTEDASKKGIING